MKRVKNYLIQTNLEGTYNIMLTFTTVNAKIIATVETEEAAIAAVQALKSLIKANPNDNNNNTN